MSLTICSLAEWERLKGKNAIDRLLAAATQEIIACPQCKGSGGVECEECEGEGTRLCSSCGSDTADCEDCEGEGSIDCELCSSNGQINLRDEGMTEDLEDFFAREGTNTHHHPSKQALYFQEVVSDIRKCCCMCGWDFLEKVGPFVRDFRQTYPHVKV